ncbi:NAD-dependent dehydratase, partial [Stenotrophomonas sp. HMWF003]
YNQVKGRLEQDLRGLGYRSLTLVRPGLIGGERSERRTGEHLASLVLGALGPVLPRAWRINPAVNIAAAMVEAALAPRPGVQIVDAAALAG